MEASVARFRAEKDRERAAARNAEVKPLYDLVHSANFKKVRDEILALSGDMDNDAEVGATVRSIKSLGRTMDRMDRMPSLKKRETE